MDRIHALSAAYQQQGSNCAETVVKAADEYFSLHMPEEVYRMVSVLGGGVGGTGCLCGALNGACLVLGYLSGRTSPGEKTKDELNGPVREFAALWMKCFRASCCRVLTRPENGGREACPVRMTGTLELLAAFVEGNHLAEP